MSRRRRRQEARDLVRRAQALPPEQIGLIMTVLLGNALVSVALEIALLLTWARAARRAAGVRRYGTRAVADAALRGPLITLTGLYGGYRVGTRVLLLRWVRRTVERAEGGPPLDD